MPVFMEYSWQRCDVRIQCEMIKSSKLSYPSAQRLVTYHFKLQKCTKDNSALSKTLGSIVFQKSDFLLV